MKSTFAIFYHPKKCKSYESNTSSINQEVLPDILSLAQRYPVKLS